MNKEYVKFKTFEELKEELGDKFEEYMYKANIELLNKMYKVIEYIEMYELKHSGTLDREIWDESSNNIYEILKGDSNE